MVAESKRFEFWLEPDTREILDTLEPGRKAKWLNEAIRFYNENQAPLFSDEKAAKVMADRIATHLLKKLKID